MFPDLGETAKFAAKQRMSFEYKISNHLTGLMNYLHHSQLLNS